MYYYTFIIIFLSGLWALGSFKYRGMCPPVSALGQASLNVCCFFLVIICISDILFCLWQDTRLDFGIFSMSVNDEWIIRAFLHFLIMEVLCAFMPVILLSHLPISFWVVSAFSYVYPWFFMCPSLARDFIKGMRIAKLSHTSCYVLCFIGLPWAW